MTQMRRFFTEQIKGTVYYLANGPEDCVDGPSPNTELKANPFRFACDDVRLFYRLWRFNPLHF